MAESTEGKLNVAVALALEGFPLPEGGNAPLNTNNDTDLILCLNTITKRVDTVSKASIMSGGTVPTLQNVLEQGSTATITTAFSLETNAGLSLLGGSSTTNITGGGYGILMASGNSAVRVTGGSGFHGLQYNADYSANQNSDRDIPDRGTVQAMIDATPPLSPDLDTVLAQGNTSATPVIITNGTEAVSHTNIGFSYSGTGSDAILKFKEGSEGGTLSFPLIETGQNHTLAKNVNGVYANDGGIIEVGLNDIALQEQPLAINIPFSPTTNEYRFFKNLILSEGNYQYLSFGDNYTQLGVSTSENPNDGGNVFVTTTSVTINGSSLTLNGSSCQINSPEIVLSSGGSDFANLKTEYVEGEKNHYLPNGNGTYTLGVSVNGGTPSYASNEGVVSLSFAGGGTVTNVSGTTNEINVATGTTTPVISLSSTFKDSLVYLTGNQSIAGTKTFTTRPIVGTASGATNDTSAASTAFVNGQIQTLINKIDKNLVVDVTDSSAVTGSSNVIAKHYELGANALSYGMLEMNIVATKTGSLGASTISVFFNTSNSLTGATQIATLTSNSASRHIGMARRFSIKGDNTINGLGFSASAASDVMLNNLAGSASFDPSNNYFILVALSNASATGDTSTIKSVEIKFRAIA